MLPKDWSAQYPTISLSRRQELAAHFKNFDELKRAIKIAHKQDVPVYFTLNEHYFTLEQYDLIENYLNILDAIEIDALLISDLALLLYIRDKFPHLKFHISTGGSTLNSETAKFYQSLGATRVILERHLSLLEIESIVKNTTLETEAFIFGSKCPNVDGFCTFHHGFLTLEDDKTRFGNACMMSYEITGSSPNQFALDRQHIWSKIHIDDRPCGICALYDLTTIGMTSIKIVGRANPSWKKIMDTSFIHNIIQFLDQHPSREKFIQVAKKSYLLTYKHPCRAIMCYYPEVM